jgi:hypothetical protein
MSSTRKMPVCLRLPKEWHSAAVAAADVAAVAVVVVAVEVEVVCVSPASAGEVHAAPAPAGAVRAAPADAVASSLEAASAALPAEVAVVVPHPAGYGRQLGVGSTAAGVALRLRLSHLASHRSKSRRPRRPRSRRTEIQSPHVRNSISAGLSVN